MAFDFVAVVVVAVGGAASLFASLQRSTAQVRFCLLACVLRALLCALLGELQKVLFRAGQKKEQKRQKAFADVRFSTSY